MNSSIPDSIPFPHYHPDNAALQWLSVSDSTEELTNESLHDDRWLLCLKSGDTAIEGFGHEIMGYILGPPQQSIIAHSSNIAQTMIRYRQVRMRFIPKHIMLMERERSLRHLGYRSTLLDSSFSELTFPSKLPEAVDTHQYQIASKRMRSYATFIYGLGIAGIQAYVQAMKITLDSGIVKVVNTLYLHQLRIYVELPDYRETCRVIEPCRHGEIREGLVLKPFPFFDSSLRYIRPNRDTEDEQYYGRIVAVKMIYLEGKHSREAMAEFEAINFLQSSISNDILSNEVVGDQLSVSDIMAEASLYLMRPHLMCSDTCRGYTIMDRAQQDMLTMAVGPSSMAGDNHRIGKLFRQLALAVFAMHRCGVCHRDISLENILVFPATTTMMLEQAALDAAYMLDLNNDDAAEQIAQPSSSMAQSNERCVLVDFEMCQRIPCIEPAIGDSAADISVDEYQSEAIPKLVRNQAMGKSLYLPIENRGKRHELIDGYACDMWALGVVLMIMLTGRFPFDPTNEKSAFAFYHHARHSDIGDLLVPPIGWRLSPATQQERLALRTVIPEDAMDALRLLLHPNRRERITAAQLLNHPWVSLA